MDQKESGRERIREAVARYSAQRAAYRRSNSSFNETQVRTDFINDLLVALGWDVYNRAGASQRLREVVVEESINVEDESSKKKPDYTLRRNGERLMFVEAKKPGVPIATDLNAAFQVRRYGWSAELRVSVLTNFDKLAVYDCTVRPGINEEASVARVSIYDHTEYADRWDEIYDQLSRESVYSGRFETLFGEASLRGSNRFDLYFLMQIEDWRKRIAQSVVLSNPHLSEQELAFIVQRLINRVVFLRICEDRGQEDYERLRKISTYEKLKTLFYEADAKYNSGLFDFVEDTLSLRIVMDNTLLIELFDDLYFPRSPYNFAVVEPAVLGAIYEQFLGKALTLSPGGDVEFRDKPEVADSHGVVPTPNYVVEHIVAATLDSLCAGKTLTEVRGLRIADIACGSGVFLLAAYQYLLDWVHEWYVAHDPASHQQAIYVANDGSWRLTLAEKHRILTECLYGVDIDEQAVEVTRFSLLLKVLDGEDAAYLDSQVSPRSKALPNLNSNIVCGNSLVDERFYAFKPSALTDPDLALAVRPLEWNEAFPKIMEAGGFSAIVGNPPYIRIQNMVHYAPHEVDFYQQSGEYHTHQGSFDKSNLFVERSLSLLRSDGVLGLIIPNRFMTVQAGQPLRQLLASEKMVISITHFGTQQVFPGRSTYTCILLAGKGEFDTFVVEHVESLDAWRSNNTSEITTMQSSSISAAPWIFISPSLEAILERIKAMPAMVPLASFADVFVGLQTSADRVYMLTPEGPSTYGLASLVDHAGRLWNIEEALLRPCIKDVSFRLLGNVQANQRMLFPYKIVDGRAVLYTPAEMQELFPMAWSYLTYHRSLLQSRAIKGMSSDNWYQFGRSQSLTKFDDTSRILWPVLSLEPRYTLDVQNTLFTGGGNGPYYAMRTASGSQEELFYLLGCLSHPFAEFFVRASGELFRGGYVSHSKKVLDTLPLISPEHMRASRMAEYKEVSTLAQQCFKVTQTADAESIASRRTIFERQRNTLMLKLKNTVSRLYNLDSNDLLLIAEFIAH